MICLDDAVADMRAYLKEGKAASTANGSGGWQCGSREAAAMRMRRQRSALALSGLGGGSVERTSGERAVAPAFHGTVGGGSVPMEVAVGDDIE